MKGIAAGADSAERLGLDLPSATAVTLLFRLTNYWSIVTLLFRLTNYWSIVALGFILYASFRNSERSTTERTRMRG